MKTFEVKTTDKEEKTWRVDYWHKAWYKSTFSLISDIIEDVNKEDRRLNYIKRID